ncbi:MAG TPA: cupin domain-containing protein [Thermoanaerobaculia bacterium]|nr:cupin domain-containing protein [Thermoanaerobaculia bacterium]HXT49456.1 cupin domain-containing protein [Thermoanaerobaculia bacterium]
MHPRAADLIETLGLQPHPEGGWFREVYRSTDVVTRDGAARDALSSIYYLLAAGQLSRWHVVTLDEVWSFHEGDPLELLVCDPRDGGVEVLKLGAVSSDGTRPQHVVPRGVWQAARPTGAYSLVGCQVGPGFDYADFQFLADLPEADAIFAGALAEYESLR